MTNDDTAVFREVALERLSSPEELDQLLHVTRLNGWLILAAVGLLTTAAAAWGLLGSLPVTVEAEGMLISPDGITDLLAGQDGYLMMITAEEGEVVERGDVVAAIDARAASPSSPDAISAAPASTAPTSSSVVAPTRGRIIEILAVPGQQLSPATPLVSFEPRADDVVAVLFVPVAEAQRIEPGMSVRLALRSRARQPHGHLDGTVARVAPFPSTVRGLTRLLADAALVEQLMSRQLRVRVDVRLAAGAADGLPVVSRTEIVGTIRVGEERPLSYVLPWLRHAGRR